MKLASQIIINGNDFSLFLKLVYVIRFLYISLVRKKVRWVKEPPLKCKNLSSGFKTRIKEREDPDIHASLTNKQIKK